MTQMGADAVMVLRRRREHAVLAKDSGFAAMAAAPSAVICVIRG
jgi:hypothetical protein